MKERGFTLVEIIIGVALLTLMTMGLYKATMGFVETVKAHSEYVQLEKVSKIINVDLAKGQIPNPSNILDFSKKWIGANTNANNFGMGYYFIVPSGISQINTNDLCSNVGSVPTFKVKTTNGGIIENVIYLLVSPTGKGENTLQKNNLQAGNNSLNLVYVNNDAFIELSPFDLVKVETKEGYTAFCDENNNNTGGGAAKKYAGCDFLIQDDATMEMVANMTNISSLQSKTVCIEPGNYTKNLIVNGGDTIIKQVNPGEVRVNQVGFYGDGQVVNLNLKANSIANDWGYYTFYQSDIEIQSSNNRGFHYLKLNKSKLSIMQGDISSSSSSSLSLTSSTMTVNGNVGISSISLTDNSTMTVNGNVSVLSSISLTSSTMTVGRNVSVSYFSSTSSSISLTDNSTMTVGGDVSVSHSYSSTSISLTSSTMIVNGNVSASSYSTAISLTDNSTMTVGGDVNASSISLTSSTMIVNGNVSASSYSTAISLTDNSTMTVGGDVSVSSSFRSSISLTDNSTMTVGGDVSVSSSFRSSMSLTSSTMTVNGNVSVSSSFSSSSSSSSISLTSSTMTVGGTNGIYVNSYNTPSTSFRDSCMKAVKLRIGSGSYYPVTTFNINTKLVSPTGSCAI